MVEIGTRIRTLREQYKISQDQLGRRVDRSKSVISSYENGLKIPPVPILVQLAKIFHVSVDYLVGIEKNEMLSVAALSSSQKQLVQSIIDELQTPTGRGSGLSEEQQAILSGLMNEFAK